MSKQFQEHLKEIQGEPTVQLSDFDKRLASSNPLVWMPTHAEAIVLGVIGAVAELVTEETAEYGEDRTGSNLISWIHEFGERKLEQIAREIPPLITQ